MITRPWGHFTIILREPGVQVKRIETEENVLYSLYLPPGEYK